MRSIAIAVSVILMSIGLAILGWVNPTLGVVFLFGGAALWIVCQKKTVLVIERVIASKSKRQALDAQSATKKLIREQFEGLSTAEKEAVKHVRVNGHILPQQVASHLASQGFADSTGVIDNIRSKTPFLLGSFSGEFSITPELKELLDELLNPPLLNALSRSVALFVVAVILLGGGYLFRKYVYPAERPGLVVNSQLPAQSNDKQSEKPKEPAPSREAKPIPMAKPPKRPPVEPHGSVGVEFSGHADNNFIEQAYIHGFEKGVVVKDQATKNSVTGSEIEGPPSPSLFENAGRADRILIDESIVVAPANSNPTIVKNDAGGEMSNVTVRKSQVSTGSPSAQTITDSAVFGVGHDQRLERFLIEENAYCDTQPLVDNKGTMADVMARKNRPVDCEWVGFLISLRDSRDNMEPIFTSFRAKLEKMWATLSDEQKSKNRQEFAEIKERLVSVRTDEPQFLRVTKELEMTAPQFMLHKPKQPE